MEINRELVDDLLPPEFELIRYEEFDDTTRTLIGIKHIETGARFGHYAFMSDSSQIRTQVNRLVDRASQRVQDPYVRAGYRT